MAFDVPEAFASDEELTPGCFLGLLHEGMEHGDHPATAEAIESPPGTGAALGPELEQPATHGLGVRRPELGTVIFEEVEQLIASRQQIHGPVLDVLANTSVVVLNPKRPFHVSARATCPRGGPADGLWAPGRCGVKESA
jgi:hypothetical protein